MLENALRAAAALSVCAIAPIAIAQEEAAPARTEMGTVVLATNHFDQAYAFYTALGMEETITAGEEPRRRVTFNAVGEESKFIGGVALYESTEPLEPGTSYLRTIYTVPDLVAACDRLAALEMPCETAPHVDAGHGGVLAADTRDPDGRLIHMYEPLD